MILQLSLIHAEDSYEYVIFTISDYEEAASLISSMHSTDVEEEYQLSTKIVFLDDYDWYNTADPNLNSYIREEVLNQGDNIKYLLLLGNEKAIPPLKIIAADGSKQPSDDFYSSIDEATTYTELGSSIPQLSTGRISANNSEQALIIANKLYNYMVNPTFGSWRSKIGLIADDENKNGYSKNELNHTINSDRIYQNISDVLNVSQFYGVNYDSVESGTYSTKPQMTSDVIDYINQGASLINYIGHGSETTLGGEKIIDMDRDLNHICSLGTECNEEKKPAIWIVGTCTFGEYDKSEEIMSEKLLFSEVGAISLITTSRGIGAYANNTYLTKLFNGIKDFVLNDNNLRIGDLVRESKENGPNTEYLFHLLGDPALILPFPKISNDDFMFDEENLMQDGLEIMKDLNNDLYDFGLAYSPYEDINITISSGEINFEDSYPDITITYALKGNQIHTGILSANSCINIPLDIEDCISCTSVDLTFFSDNFNNTPMYNGRMKIIKNVPVYLNDDFENDNTGPQISLYQSGIEIKNGSIVNNKFPIEINIEDTQGINLMDQLQHNVRYWFNNDSYIYSINSNLFEYNEDACGKVSADFSLPDDLSAGNNSITIEAWDNANNRTLIQYNFSLINNQKKYVNHLYNFPNPFENYTFFTFYLSEYPADIEINIYNIHGEQVKTLKKICNDYYNVLKWDGKTDFGQELSTGPYIYSFKSKATIDGLEHTYESINKIAKLK